MIRGNGGGKEGEVRKVKGGPLPSLTQEDLILSVSYFRLLWPPLPDSLISGDGTSTLPTAQAESLVSSSVPLSLTSTLLSQPLHRAQTYPLSPSLHPKASSWSCLLAASSLVSLLPPCSQRDPVNTGVRSCPSPVQGPLVAPSQVKVLCLVTHGHHTIQQGSARPAGGAGSLRGPGRSPILQGN